MKYYSKNYTELKKRGIDIEETILIKQKECSEKRSYIYSTSEAGFGIDSVESEKGIFCLQDSHTPMEEARIYASSFCDTKKGAVILLMGLGNGYILRDILNVIGEATLIVYEPDPYYVSYVMEHYDMSDIFGDNRFHLYIRGVNDDSMKLHMYAYVNGFNWHIFEMNSLPGYKELYPEDYIEIEKLYEESRLNGKQDYYVGIDKAKNNVYNAVKNLEFIYRGDSIYSYKDILSQDVPVIIVAAGPSLEKNIGILKEYKDKAIILCVDRVAPIMAKYSIKPNAYVTVDAEKENELFDIPEEINAPWFAYTTSSYEGLKKTKNGGIIFCSTIFEYGSEIYRRIGSGLDTLANGGSVATVALNIALYLGTKRIIFVGQDLALTDNKVHAGEETQGFIEDGNNYFSVKGFYGDKILTRGDFKFYLDYYTAFVHAHPEIEFINATEGGAYIDGMKHMSLSDAMEKYGFFGEYSNVFDGCYSFMNEERKRIVAESYGDLLSFFEEIDKRVDGAVSAMDNGIRILKKDGILGEGLDVIEEVMNGFLDMYNSHIGHTILDLGIAKEIQEALMFLEFKEDDITNELIRLYGIMQVYFKGIRDVDRQVLPLMKEVLSSISEGSGR